MVDKLIDMSKMARSAIRLRRRTCSHDWQKRRNGVEVCTGCGDHFPCGGDSCEHLDCIERGVELGRRTGFPRDFSFGLTVLAEHHRSGDDCPGCAVEPEGHYEYLVTPGEDPETWILNVPLELTSDQIRSLV